MKFGLDQNTIEKLNNIFLEQENIERVIIYGSRAKGNFKNGSDIDVTIVSNKLTHADLMKLEVQIDDLLLPYKIDLSLFHQISNPDLVDHINRVGKVLYQKKNTEKE